MLDIFSMRSFFKFILSAIFVLMSTEDMMAYDCEVDGIYYNLRDGEAVVTYNSENRYSGSVTIPGSIIYEGKTYTVSKVGSSAFSNCEDLISVDMPNSITEIDNWAFQRCKNLASVKLSSNLKNISYMAFYECSQISSMSLPEGLETIGNEAFESCRNLSSINMPNSVISVGFRAFRWCDKLSTPLYNQRLFVFCPTSTQGQYAIPDGIQVVCSSAFEYCRTSSVVIPNSVTVIGSNAFCASSIESVTIPQQVKIIESYTFDRCYKLKKVVLPSSLDSIGNGAFNQIYDGIDVYCYATTPPSTTKANQSPSSFDLNLLTKSTLHVPAASIDKYTECYQWSEFGKIVALTDEELAAGIDADVKISNSSNIIYYDVSGRQHNVLQQGINIIQKSSGKRVKVMKR